MIEREIELTDGVVLLRPPKLNDVSHIFEAIRESIPDMQRWMSWCDDDYSEDETYFWVQKQPPTWERENSYNFMITDAKEGTILGGCGINHINHLYRFGNLGYWIRSGRRGEGLAGRAAHLVAQFGFSTLGLMRAEIVVPIENKASLRVAQKMGAQWEGILRNRILVREKSYDAVMHSLVPQDFGIEPSIPNPF